MSKQLLKDISELLKAGIISEETASKIARYYKLEKQTAPNILTVVLAILGALLVGSGILLVIAHNWDELTPHKNSIVVFSFARCTAGLRLHFVETQRKCSMARVQWCLIIFCSGNMHFIDKPDLPGKRLSKRVLTCVGSTGVAYGIYTIFINGCNVMFSRYNMVCSIGRLF